MFGKILTKYQFGDWKAALSLIDELLKSFPADGPSMFLKKYMQENYSNQAVNGMPICWQGYRNLKD